jgi:hypothetical protein
MNQAAGIPSDVCYVLLVIIVSSINIIHLYNLYVPCRGVLFFIVVACCLNVCFVVYVYLYAKCCINVEWYFYIYRLTTSFKKL